MSVGISRAGILLLDAALNIVAANQEAVQILTFAAKPEKTRRLDVFISERVKVTLAKGRSPDGQQFVKEFKSGNRVYVCRRFQFDYLATQVRLPIALVLERNSSCNAAGFSEICERFDLTQRERETVELLLQGLTSKEIANRMAISPNTVKAFLRLVMVKMGVSTRSGIAGRMVGSAQ